MGVAAAIVAVAVARGRISGAEVVFFAVLIPSIILHEISHGVVALAFGDDTAKEAGRLTLNPIPHIDPVGTVVVPAIMAFSGLGAFGWAKPVPVNYANLRNRRPQALLVSLAGPATNLVLAAVTWMAFIAVTPPEVISAISASRGNALILPNGTVAMVLLLASVANVWIAVFNFLPIPPLDGSALVEVLLPRRWLPGYLRLRAMTLPLVLLFVIFGSRVLGALFRWAVAGWTRILGTF